MMTTHIIIPIILLFNLCVISHSFAHNACEAEMITASGRYGVPLGILYAVGLTETGYEDSLQPYALNIEGKTVFAHTEGEALRIFNYARKKGARLIDLGCMQINYYYHAAKFSSPRAMLQPAANVDYAARLLRSLYDQQRSWTAAIARYHAGSDNEPAQKRYICRVIRNMIATGFGRWTKESEEFCRVNMQ
ncbi:MAG: SLT domain-containing transglycosylase [Candidatus Tokpelaia sp. JSC188]|nr:MAG: SLT domain-containing transglycosylase [Candidatus Tokpelaia sp. JSC188]